MDSYHFGSAAREGGRVPAATSSRIRQFLSTVDEGGALPSDTYVPSVEPGQRGTRMGDLTPEDRKRVYSGIQTLGEIIETENVVRPRDPVLLSQLRRTEQEMAGERGATAIAPYKPRTANPGYVDDGPLGPDQLTENSATHRWHTQRSLEEHTHFPDETVVRDLYGVVARDVDLRAVEECAARDDLFPLSLMNAAKQDVLLRLRSYMTVEGQCDQGLYRLGAGEAAECTLAQLTQRIAERCPLRLFRCAFARSTLAGAPPDALARRLNLVYLMDGVARYFLVLSVEVARSEPRSMAELAKEVKTELAEAYNKDMKRLVKKQKRNSVVTHMAAHEISSMYSRGYVCFADKGNADLRGAERAAEREAWRAAIPLFVTELVADCRALASVRVRPLFHYYETCQCEEGQRRMSDAVAQAFKNAKVSVPLNDGAVREPANPNNLYK